MSKWGTSYDVTTPAGWAAVFKAMQPADWIPSDGKEIWLHVVDWVSHPHEVVDRSSGEVKLLNRLVLIGKDGRTAALCGDWNIRNLRAAIVSYPGRWPQQGMPTRVYADKSRKQGASDYGTFEFHPELIKYEEEPE